jgi:hypothetical protein
MGSEDVGLFSLDGKIPAVMYWLGAADEGKLGREPQNRRAAAGIAFGAVCAGLCAGYYDWGYGDEWGGAGVVEVSGGYA